MAWYECVREIQIGLLLGVPIGERDDWGCSMVYQVLLNIWMESSMERLFIYETVMRLISVRRDNRLICTVNHLNLNLIYQTRLKCFWLKAVNIENTEKLYMKCNSQAWMWIIEHRCAQGWELTQQFWSMLELTADIFPCRPSTLSRSFMF